MTNDSTVKEQSFRFATERYNQNVDRNLVNNGALGLRAWAASVVLSQRRTCAA